MILKLQSVSLESIMGKMKRISSEIYSQKDKLWFIIWLSVIAIVWLWNNLFLNLPALKQIEAGFLNTFLISFLVILFTLILSWFIAISLNALESKKYQTGYFTAAFFLNLIRSIPQIVGVLFGYVWITYLIEKNVLQNKFYIILLIAFIMSLFVFLEMVDLMRERINHYKKLDFYNAMLVCGIKERRIINYDILWKNSRAHIFNKLIALFGAAVFLQCSIDFIISVGLSTDVSSVNLPVTLGSLLAKIDSKQDILAIGNTITNPGYIGKIFFEHLQGVTVAFLIVFTLICIYKISDGFAERFRL